MFQFFDAWFFVTNCRLPVLFDAWRSAFAAADTDPQLLRCLRCCNNAQGAVEASRHLPTSRISSRDPGHDAMFRLWGNDRGSNAEQPRAALCVYVLRNGNVYKQMLLFSRQFVT